jgi:hypothetical protein
MALPPQGNPSLFAPLPTAFSFSDGSHKVPNLQPSIVRPFLWTIGFKRSDPWLAVRSHSGLIGLQRLILGHWTSAICWSAKTPLQSQPAGQSRELMHQNSTNLEIILRRTHLRPSTPSVLVKPFFTLDLSKYFVRQRATLIIY